MDLVIFPELVLNFYYEGLLQDSPQEEKFFIPGKRSATRNPGFSNNSGFPFPA
jgi:hypothetical protein